MPYKDLQKAKEYQKKYQAEWSKNNKEKKIGYWRKYYYLNKEAILKTKRGQRRLREQTQQVSSRRYHRDKINTLRKYGENRIPFCVCCGEKKYEFLTIDHIIPKKGIYQETCGENLYRRLLKIPLDRKKYQILCYNCNMGKRVNETCPHKKSLFPSLEEWEDWSKLLYIKTPNHIKKLWTRKREF